ncbi:MAG: HIT domain-containing protein [Verrucomicrobia bacterium]|nr:HIT domain-containing protein [Verrucomicrobiota bacterium]
MEALHAPWRIHYILGPKRPLTDTSLFSEIGQSSDDVANHVIARERTCYAMLNAYPYNGGHLMVVPYRQVADLEELHEQERAGLMELVIRCQKALRQVMKPDGFNIGINLGKAAGAGIAEHLHVHIVPRWSGDTNFMAVIAGTQVVPQALTDLASQLRAALVQ